MNSDTDFMQLALEQARQAATAGEVPVGAVLVLRDRLIATGANRPISVCDPTAHAEIEALRAGAAGSMLDAFALPGLNHRVDVFGGVLQEQCSALLTQFFEPRRQ